MNPGINAPVAQERLPQEVVADRTLARLGDIDYRTRATSDKLDKVIQMLEDSKKSSHAGAVMIFLLAFGLLVGTISFHVGVYITSAI